MTPGDMVRHSEGARSIFPPPWPVWSVEDVRTVDAGWDTTRTELLVNGKWQPAEGFELAEETT